ncbi:MAG: NUDIX hydrolase [Candidatus Latescibacteria bacterium]|nr:NUDIX hydrolase [Candidatus Latescibacterota bacterium]
MTEKNVPQWLLWAREIQAISQTGLHYCESQYDTQRYTRLMEIAAEIVENNTGIENKPIVDNFKIQPGYATPKVDIRGAVVNNGKILLVRERSDGLWCMPGGWADVGDYPSDVAAREVWEESGYKVKPVNVVGVYDNNRSGTPLEFYHAYKIVFLCELTGGEARTSNETSAVDFFSFDNLPPLSWERTGERHLNDVRAFAEDNTLPTVFD